MKKGFCYLLWRWTTATKRMRREGMPLCLCCFQVDGNHTNVGLKPFDAREQFKNFKAQLVGNERGSGEGEKTAERDSRMILKSIVRLLCWFGQMCLKASPRALPAVACCRSD